MMKTTAVLALLTALLLLSGAVWAHGGYDLSWGTVDGGGGASEGGGYVLSGSSGQPDAGVLAGGEYVLNGGFWAGGAPVEEPPGLPVYLPIVENGR